MFSLSSVLSSASWDPIYSFEPIFATSLKDSYPCYPRHPLPCNLVIQLAQLDIHNGFFLGGMAQKTLNFGIIQTYWIVIASQGHQGVRIQILSLHALLTTNNQMMFDWFTQEYDAKGWT